MPCPKVGPRIPKPVLKPREGGGRRRKEGGGEGEIERSILELDVNACELEIRSPKKDDGHLVLV